MTVEELVLAQPFELAGMANVLERSATTGYAPGCAVRRSLACSSRYAVGARERPR